MTIFKKWQILGQAFKNEAADHVFARKSQGLLDKTIKTRQFSLFQARGSNLDSNKCIDELHNVFSLRTQKVGRYNGCTWSGRPSCHLGSHSKRIQSNSESRNTVKSE